MLYRTMAQWEELVNELEVLWRHDENMKRPHALLTSGKHSNGFFDAGRLFFQYPRIARQLVFDFIKGKGIGDLPQQPQQVMGPAFGAITLARDVADVLDIGFCFALPEGDGSSKTFTLEKRFNVRDQLVLVVEDVITTAGSVRKTIDAVQRAGGIVMKNVLAICNRSGTDMVDERRIVAMFDKPMPTWEARECPYCKAGSEAIRPKEAGNWQRLSAKY